MKKFKIKKIFSLFLLVLLFSLFIAPNALAIAPLSETVGCMKSGDCGINDFVLLAVGVSKMILGISGSVTLLFFIYGGVMMLISGGSQERVSKGKQIIINSVIGLVIIFTSYTIIAFSLKALGINNSTKWFQATPLDKK